jgi:hypothetical protein
MATARLSSSWSPWPRLRAVWQSAHDARPRISRIFRPPHEQRVSNFNLARSSGRHPSASSRLWCGGLSDSSTDRGRAAAASERQVQADGHRSYGLTAAAGAPCVSRAERGFVLRHASISSRVSLPSRSVSIESKFSVSRAAALASSREIDPSQSVSSLLRCPRLPACQADRN